MPKFSVVIACYNAADTLPETLAALRAQTEQDWEAICVDDGSSDGTLRLLTTAAQGDARIRVITQVNAGPSRARNAGVALARADWIAFLDADDIWLPGKLAHIRTTIDNAPYSDGVYGQIAFYDPRADKITTHSTVKNGDTTVKELLGENPVCTLSNLCVRRDAFFEVGSFREDMRYSEDLEFLIRFVAAGKRLTGTNTLLVTYRASSDGLSANLMQMHQGWREAVRSAGASLLPPSRARAEAIHLRYLARRALRLNVLPFSALRLALHGFWLAPLTFLGGGHRGPLTLISCLLAPMIPSTLRRCLFA